MNTIHRNEYDVRVNLFQFETMSAASAARGAESTSRPLMESCSSFLVCVSTTWSLTATRSTKGFRST